MKKNADMIDPSELKAYDNWIADHFDELVKNYPGKVIAVYRGKLVAVADSYKEAFASARAQGIAEPPLTMEVPTKDDLEAILPHRIMPENP